MSWEHVWGIIRGRATSIHALRVLRSHGLNDAALQTVYRAVIVARLTYATSAWWIFITSDDRQRIEGLLRREIRAGYYRPDCPAVENLMEDADGAFPSRFKQSTSSVTLTVNR